MAIKVVICPMINGDFLRIAMLVIARGYSKWWIDVIASAESQGRPRQEKRDGRPTLPDVSCHIRKIRRETMWGYKHPIMFGTPYHVGI